MPQKPSQKTSEAKFKPITDFFPRKANLLQDRSPSGSCTSTVIQKNVKQSSTKENATPHHRTEQPRAEKANDRSLNSNTSTNSPRSCLGAGIGSPVPAKIMTITPPMQPSTKRLRSQSIVPSRSSRNVKRFRNILPDSRSEEEKMEVDEDSVVYVRPRGAVTSKPASMHLPTSDPTRKKSRLSTSPGLRLEVGSLVPSSLSEEKELEPNRPEHRDIGMVREAVDHWRKRALPPSPPTNASSPVESQVLEPSQPSSLVVTADWSMVDDATPSRPIPTTTSIPTPPSTDGPFDAQLKLTPMDARVKTEQIIADIKARAYAASRATPESSPLLSEIESIYNSEDENDTFGDLGLKINKNSASSSKCLSNLPEPERYNLRNHLPLPKLELGQQKSKPRLLRDASPSLAICKPSINPLDALLKEKRTVKPRKSALSTADREARLRGLVDLNLDDDSESDGGISVRALKGNALAISETDGNPFIDDDQKQQVLGIFQGDRDIETEEEYLKRHGMVGVLLWSSSESRSMDVCDHPSLQLTYCGSDPVLQTFAQTVVQGNYALIQLTLQSGALESADYADEGSSVIDYLEDLAFSCFEDDLGLSALQVLSHIWTNPISTACVTLFETVLNTLRALGAELSVLESLGWLTTNVLRRDISENGRSVIIDRLVHCIANVAKSRQLHLGEAPDIVVALLLVSMDPSTRHEMRLEIRRAIHEICQSIGEKDEVNAEVESAVCNKVLHLIGPYALQNKCHVLDVFAGGSGRTARIARSMAHAMLTDKFAMLPSQYAPLPPLSGLMTTLEGSPKDADLHLGKFEICEGTDYIEMACWTSVLAVALNDVPRYMETEEARKATPSPRTSPLKEKDSSLVLALHHKLYKIHGRIQDTRAAHLDRSRTKAIIFQTAFRILYQYQTISRYRTTNNRNIHHYFRRK